ncbi:carboxymuconolactone decarboxylase family protein [Komagataeibacter oboediens]|uniref:carboxymuconolactone decarboxylase family protein n=2 Tax=Acetobacterales TaxID=3120395 RepID=UPI001C2DE77E|nr:carboxymuconolactone decarboxylase family protein [Komagataeibacter oboediens]MBV1825383.1 carboxymuconolactone decarboxylase family protein [Komagataeibacter oboediens]
MSAVAGSIFRAFHCVYVAIGYRVRFAERAESAPLDTGGIHALQNDEGEQLMADEPTAARQSFGDIAPELAEISDKVLFGQVWAGAGLSSRDRSLVTITSLISLYRENELPFHMKKALENGLTKDEIIAVITQLAFYSGWPTAMTALSIARQVFADADAAQQSDR